MNQELKERVPFRELSPEWLAGLYATQGFIESTELSKRLLTLIRVRTSQINRCAFCLDMHQQEAKGTVTAQELVGLSAWQDAPYFSHQERLVLQLVEQMAQMDRLGGLGAAYQSVEDSFGREKACAISIVVTQISSWNQLCKTFGFLPPTGR